MVQYIKLGIRVTPEQKQILKTIAIETNQLNICYEISVDSIREECFEYMALSHNNISLCELSGSRKDF